MNAILLTAAVDPNPLFKSKIADINTRRSQYQKAVASWSEHAKHIGWKLIVVETSGFSPVDLIEGISETEKDQVEVLSYEPPHELLLKGKGAAEAAAMDYAIQKTKFNLGYESAIFKSTGRLVVQNAAQLIVTPPANTVYVRRSLDRRYCDTRFFGTTVGFWRSQLMDMAGEVDEAAGKYLEHVLAFRLAASEFHSHSQVLSFSRRPLIGGYSGTTGATYSAKATQFRDIILQPLEKVCGERLSRKQI